MQHRHITWRGLQLLGVLCLIAQACSKDEIVQFPTPPANPSITNVPNTFLYSFDAHSATADSQFYLSFDLDSSVYTLSVSDYLHGTGFIRLYDVGWGVMRVDTVISNRTVTISDFQGTLPGAILVTLADFTGRIFIVDSARAAPRQMTASGFPNAIGTEWIYAVNDNSLLQTDTLRISVFGYAVLPNGRPVTLRRLSYRSRTDTDYVYLANDTVLTDIYPRGSVYESMTYVFPVKIGKRWWDPDETNVVAQNYQVVVPYGTLGNAFRIEKTWYSYNDYYQVTTWLVPGIGIAKRIRDDYRNHIITWELISFLAPPTNSSSSRNEPW